MSKQYHIEAVWDAEAGVFYSKSNIPGLIIEAATFPEFFEIVNDVAPDLLRANAPRGRGPKPKGRTVRVETELTFVRKRAGR